MGIGVVSHLATCLTLASVCVQVPLRVDAPAQLQALENQGFGTGADGRGASTD